MPSTNLKMPSGKPSEVAPRYVQGARLAAAYLGMSKKTALRELKIHGVRPRIIGGRRYYNLRDLDRLMNPELNAPGEETRFFGRQVP